MWDNGAFSAFTRGAEFDVQGYYAWLDSRLVPPHWAVVPDEIGGDEQAQRRMVGTWPYSKQLGAPVWHMHLPIGYLLRLLETWPKVCFGSSAEYWQVGSDAWRRRADEAWNAIAQSGGRPWVHMLRGLAMVDEHWPFASADSTNIARSHATRGRPAAMAASIDRRQTPARWRAPAEQLRLIEEGAP